MDIILAYTMLPHSERSEGLNAALFKEPMACQNQYKREKDYNLKKENFSPVSQLVQYVGVEVSLAMHFEDASK